MIDWGKIQSAEPPESVGREIFHVRVSEICPNGLQSVCSLAEYLQEAAFRNSTLLNLGMESLKDTGTAWVLARLSLHVRHYPRNGEAVGVETWYAGIKGRFGQRFYRLRDKNDMVIASALTTFALFDLETRSIAEWPNFIKLRMPEAGPLPIDFHSNKIDTPASSKNVDVIHPRLGDVDLYDHVNNTKLIEWALASSAQGLKHPFQPRAIDILFRKECRLDDQVHPAIDQIDEQHTNVILKNQNNQEIIRALITR